MQLLSLSFARENDETLNGAAAGRMEVVWRSLDGVKVLIKKLFFSSLLFLLLTSYIPCWLLCSWLHDERSSKEMRLLGSFLTDEQSEKFDKD